MSGLRAWWALAVWCFAMIATALPFLPWWVHGPGTLALVVLVSRAAHANHGLMCRLNELLVQVNASGERAVEWHAEHRARLDDVEQVAVFGAGRVLVSGPQARLASARERVLDRLAQ